MATPNSFSVQLAASLLEGSNTVVTPGPGTAETGSIAESYVVPFQLAAGETDVNMKLGMLTNPKFLAVWADKPGVSFKIYSTGDTALPCNPFAFLSEVDDGMTNVSEVWLTNTGSQAAAVTVMAAE
jgi:hypothetical protein